MFQAPWDVPDNKPSLSWPEEGRVKFDNYSTRYRPGLELVLKGLTFSVDSCEKVVIFI